MSVRSINPEFIKHYKIERFFQTEKKGGQKTVFFPIIDGKPIVLKLFASGKDDRFDREMEIYEKFKHLNGIPKIIGTDTYGDDTIVFEEYVEGDTLIDIAAKYAGQGDEINQLLKEVFAIMKPVWEASYVHRDFKPENIIIRKDGKPVIIDFGIARDLTASSITGTGIQPGSWRFASPEQYEGNKDMISYRTDFFSLGALAYFLYHQRLPFGNTPEEIKNRFKAKDEAYAFDPGFPLQNFCTETMKFSPAERPRKIEDLISIL